MAGEETKRKLPVPLASPGSDAGQRLRGIFWIGLTVLLAFGMRMLEWPSWNDPEYRLGFPDSRG